MRGAMCYRAVETTGRSYLTGPEQESNQSESWVVERYRLETT